MSGDWRERARERVGDQAEADLQEIIDEEAPGDEVPRPGPAPRVGVGMPAMIRLEAFGMRVFDAFGDLPYLVGSAAVSKTWRDVDVRLMLPDDQFKELFPGYERLHQHHLKWSLLCDALSELAHVQTGLPVDFQIQSVTDANRRYDGVRVPLGIRIAEG